MLAVRSLGPDHPYIKSAGVVVALVAGVAALLVFFLPAASPPTSSTTDTPVQADEQQAIELLKEARGWESKFRYDFDGDAQGWPIPAFQDEDGYGSSITSITPDNKYRWEVSSNRETTFWVEHPPLASEAVSDFYAEVEAEKLAGSPEKSAYCLLFRAPDDDNHYSLRVRQNGQFFSAVDLSYPGFIRYLENINTIQSQAIKETEVNKLAVIARESTFWFYINDRFVGKATDARLQKGRIIIAVYMDAGGQKATFEFDNFEVRVPPQE